MTDGPTVQSVIDFIQVVVQVLLRESDMRTLRPAGPAESVTAASGEYCGVTFSFAFERYQRRQRGADEILPPTHVKWVIRTADWTLTLQAHRPADDSNREVAFQIDGDTVRFEQFLTLALLQKPALKRSVS